MSFKAGLVILFWIWSVCVVVVVIVVDRVGVQFWSVLSIVLVIVLSRLVSLLLRERAPKLVSLSLLFSLFAKMFLNLLVVEGEALLVRGVLCRHGDHEGQKSSNLKI